MAPVEGGSQCSTLSVLGFSELGKFGMVHQVMALGSILKVSVASEDLSFLLGEGC